MVFLSFSFRRFLCLVFLDFGVSLADWEGNGYMYHGVFSYFFKGR